METLTPDKYLDESEIEQLQEILDKYRDSDTRDVLLIELALNTGIREGELIRIKKSDLKKSYDARSKRWMRYVFVSKPEKGSSKRIIPLKAALFDALESYSQTFRGDLLFPISTSRVRQIWMHYRPFSKPFHSLRHTFGRRMYEIDHDLRTVQYLLGHKSIQNTQIYTEVQYTPNILCTRYL